MEARLYAEDPAKGFLPSIGTLEVFDLGETDGGRIDYRASTRRAKSRRSTTR
jgi:acetyl/propionyl-CoA carboxylase alpha subunit